MEMVSDQHENGSKKPVSRRNFLGIGFGAALGGIGATKAWAQRCDPATGAQALGPFFPNPQTPIDVIREDNNPNTPLHLANDSDLTFVQGRSGKATGQVVYVKGIVKNESCQAIAGATLVLWQAAHSGRYNHKGDSENHDFTHPVTGQIIKRTHDPSFQYWGRALTNAKGEYLFKTIVPGFYPADLAQGWYRPPHLHLMVTATGYPQLVTQMYFRGEKIVDNAWIQDLNQKDLLLQGRNLSSEQREKLVVDFKQVNDELIGQFDINLQKA
jgi:protocatechuate 3,4-dioxygenase beta subunit